MSWWNPSTWFSPKPMNDEHFVKATSFADPADIAAFKRAKARGLTDNKAFKYGDNGIGYWGDDCTTGQPMCALPHEDWEERWGDDGAARKQPIIVSANGKTVTCLLGDTMPHRANITNGGGIDLNPAACKALGLNPPVDTKAIWNWA